MDRPCRSTRTRRPAQEIFEIDDELVPIMSAGAVALLDRAEHETGVMT
ncbi:MAG: hypothetical protein H0T14_08450 [Nocardioidaceae bacterium]|nr:hypothetical protein [Nocardioidaceae bacterium]